MVYLSKENMVGNQEARHDLARSCRDALSKKCQRIHKTGQNKKRSYKKRTRDLWSSKTWDPNTNKTGSTILKEWTTPDSRNTPSTTNFEEEEIMGALGNDDNASMPEQLRRPNPWRKMMMMMMMMMKIYLFDLISRDSPQRFQVEWKWGCWIKAEIICWKLFSIIRPSR